jgi:hypothetical protein
MTPTPPQKRREPIKEIDGHKFYKIDSADEILHTRHMVAEVQELYIRSGISEQFLQGISQLIIDRALEVNDVKKLREDMIAIGQNLKGRLGMLASRQLYEQLACVYVLMDDEPMDYDEEWQKRKIAVWRAAGEADFFSLLAFRHMHELATILDKDILAAWQAASERISQLPTLPKLSTGI